MLFQRHGTMAISCSTLRYYATICVIYHGMVWYGMVDVYDGYLAAEASGSSLRRCCDVVICTVYCVLYVALIGEALTIYVCGDGWLHIFSGHLPRPQLKRAVKTQRICCNQSHGHTVLHQSSHSRVGRVRPLTDHVLC